MVFQNLVNIVSVIDVVHVIMDQSYWFYCLAQCITYLRQVGVIVSKKEPDK